MSRKNSTGESIDSPERGPKTPIAERFRGFLPVVVDVETGGFNASTDALLEIAISIIEMDREGLVYPGEVISWNVQPFEGANLDPAALAFTGITDPFSPLREALVEAEVLTALFRPVRKQIKSTGCNRAILVGHNAFFDHSFLFEATRRAGVSRNPFHQFSTLDTAALSALAFGHTVLSRTCRLAGIDFSNEEAHSAAYDTLKTAELFCEIVNRWKQMGGWEDHIDR